jgi:hypothetical protein
MKKIILFCLALSLVLSVVSFSFTADTTTVNGYVSDSMCGAKGAKDGHTDCANKCIAKGAGYVVVTDGDQNVLTVSNPEALKGHEGHHVAVTGEVASGSIHVDSVKML